MKRSTSLDTKISSLADIGDLRNELQQALFALRHQGDPPQAMDQLARTTRMLIGLVFEAAKRRPPDGDLRAWAEAANKAGLLPQPLYFSFSGILDWSSLSSRAIEPVRMTSGRAEIHLAILLEAVVWYCCEYEKGPHHPLIYREGDAGGGVLPALDIKIASLDDIGALRDELQKGLSTLRHADNPISVMNGLSRTALIMLSLVFEKAGYKKRPSDNLGDCCDKALDANLLPLHIYNSLGSVRVWSNKADHAVEQVALTTGRAEIQLAFMLEAITWYCCEYEKGPHLPFICREERTSFRFAAPPPGLQSDGAFLGDWPPFRGECIGREASLADLRQVLTAERVLNLEGGPGYGKTRLAKEYAEASKALYQNGLFFANLTTLPVGPNSLSLRLYLDQFLQALTDGGESSLLVLDNCEHLDGVAVQEIQRLQNEQPRLHILATSRTRLNGLQGYPVMPLAMPEEIDGREGALSCKAIAEYGSIRLFLTRARLVDPNIEINEDNVERVVAICRKVGGIPFAIELVANLVKFQLENILESLDDWLAVGSGQNDLSANDLSANGLSANDLAETDVRHSTVDGCVRWSINLLSKDTQEFLCNASIFRGGFTLAAYRDVILGRAKSSAPDQGWHNAILELTSHGLILHGANNLFELPGPVRLFALRQLKNSKEHYETRRKSYEKWLEAQHELSLLRQIGNQDADKIHLAIANADEAIQVAERIAPKSAKKDTVSKNELRAAQVRSQRATYLMISGKIFQSMSLFRQALPYMPDYRKCEVLIGIGMVLYLKCQFPEALTHCRESAEIAAKVGDVGIEVLAMSSQGVLEGFVMGPNPETHGRIDGAIELSKRYGDIWTLAYAYLSKGTYLWQASQFSEAEKCYLTALENFDAVNDKILSVFALNSLGHLTRIDGRFSEAAQYYLRSMKLSQGLLFERGRCGCVLGTSGMAVGLGKHEDAVIFWGAAMRQYTRLTVKMIPPIERCYKEKFEALFRATEAEESGKFARLYQQGQSLTLPQAFDRARSFLEQVQEAEDRSSFASFMLS